MIGEVDDTALAQALRGATAHNSSDAQVCIACVAGEQELAEAVEWSDLVAPGRPLWIVNRKGARSAFGETAVRLAMRNAGFMDNKVASVSTLSSATRYARKGRN